MFFQIYFLGFFVLISIVKRVFVFEISDPNCLYKEGGDILPEITSTNSTIRFFLPYNWEKWRENNELIIESDHLTIVLSHPSYSIYSKWQTKSEKEIFLPLDYLKIGWNQIWLSKSHQNVVINDVDGNIWLHKTTVPIQTWKNWKVYGLYAFANCQSSFYKYFNVKENNIKIPLVANKNGGQITVYSLENFQMEINFSRKKVLICQFTEIEQFYLRENGLCSFDLTTTKQFIKNQDHIINVYFGKNLDIQENYMTVENFIYTDFLIHNLENKKFMVRTLLHFTDVNYLDYNKNIRINEESVIEKELIMKDHMPVTNLIILTAISFVAFISILIAYIRERRLRIISTMVTEEITITNKEKQKSASQSDNHSSYELKNDNYENFSFRKEPPKTLLKQQPEESEIYELNNSLYEDLDQRKSKMFNP